MEEVKNINTAQANVDEIIIDDGSVEVPIRNKLGEIIGRFSFRPTDVGIIDRFNKLAGDFEKITAPLENVNINPDGTADANNEAELAAMREAETNLYNACNALFGGDMAGAFFGAMHPFSPINGRFYCEIALNAVSRYISKQFSREVKQINSRVERYTHGYRTGKHRNGKQK